MGLEAESGPSAAQGTTGPAIERELGRPDPARIREQLEHILGSSEFLGSDRARRFLRYVVEETLAGRGGRIKAFSVAVAAFDRDETFDAQNDPIVRIEAGRLRRFLERYYLVGGAADPIRIDIPKGAYVPTFSWLHSQEPDDQNIDPSNAAPRAAEETSVLSKGSWTLLRLSRLLVVATIGAVLLGGVVIFWTMTVSDEPVPVADLRPTLPQPSIAVLPFNLSGDALPVTNLSNGMTGELIRELARYSSVFVLGPQSVSRFGPAPDVVVIGKEAGVRFVLSGGIQHVGQRIRVAVQLNDTETGGVVWAEAYERDFAVERVFDLQTEIAREVVRRIAQPQGAIALFDWKRTRGKAPETWDAYDCVVQADDLHRRVLPPALAPEIRTCLRRAVEQEPGYADAWVMSALVEIDALRFTPLASASMEGRDIAHVAARRAVELAPDSGRAHLALALTLFFRGEVEQSLAAGELAARLSPHDPDVLGEVGMRNILSGDLEVGVALVNQAIALERNVSITSRLALALAALRKGQYQAASDAARGDAQGSNFIYWCVVSAIHGRAGRLEEARSAADELRKLYPDFPDWAWEELAARNVGPELAAVMAEGWRAAGLPVPLSGSGSNP
ncbi:MAG: hypothetical protein ACFCUT_07405 [Kiloniellaceae bacterium]